MLKERIKIGVFGLGTVGQGVIELLQTNRELIRSRVGKDLVITRAVTRNPGKKRQIDLSTLSISDQPSDILDDPEIDVVVELMGGLDLAEAVICGALAKGKAVVTANKALLAERANTIFQTAYVASQFFGFEASVGGGIPIIRSLRESFAGDKIEEISGIINGTANYILTEMTEKDAEFVDVLAEAQSKGYAEADPTFDIEGMDTAHKLIILANLAFNGIFNYHDLFVEGITGIEKVDIQYAHELGYKIKLLGKAYQRGNGFEGRVHPTMIPEDQMLASVNGVYNAIQLKGNFVGTSVLVGRGAGAHPTASAVVGDIIQASRNLLANQTIPLFPLSTSEKKLAICSLIPMSKIRTEYYLRFSVLDQVGVLAQISKILGEKDISIRSVIQKTQSHTPDKPVYLVITTHEALEENVQQALQEIDHLPIITAKTKLIRMDA